MLIIAAGLHESSAQTLDISPEELSPLRKVYEGKYHFIEETGDTVLMLVFYPITVFLLKKLKIRKEENFYWKLLEM